MDETIKLLVEKFDRYNFLTNMLPGAVLCMALEHFVGYKLLVSNELILSGVIIYFVGVVNNRFGSLVIEPILRWRWIKFAPYKDFLNAEKLDNKIRDLSTENNAYRSYIAVFSLSLLAILFKAQTSSWPLLKEYEEVIILCLLIVLFAFSYHKQTEYIKKRIKISIDSQSSSL